MTGWWIYLLVILGFGMLPVYVMQNGAPAITRKKAMRTSKNKLAILILRKFWILHGLNTIIGSSALIYQIETWNDDVNIVRVALIVTFLLSALFSGIMASIPAYVMTKHWKHNAGR